MSEEPRPLRKPRCDSGSSFSATCCSLSYRILATTFPTMSSREIPLQLSQIDRSPFFGMGIRIASDQSIGTQCSSHAVCTNSSKRVKTSSVKHPAFSISGRAAVSSLMVGFAATSVLIGWCLVLPSSATSNWDLMFSTLVNCHCHRWCCSDSGVHLLPSLSQTQPVVLGSRPLLPDCIAKSPPLCFLSLSLEPGVLGYTDGLVSYWWDFPKPLQICCTLAGKQLVVPML